ncbi:MAG: ABC transporter permease [Anaerolineales bacterium]|nr:ABC transporter permease [Anaerolineales bacterium]
MENIPGYSLPEAVPVYDSARRRFTALEEFRELINYRHLLYQMVRRDILTRYKRSVLGVAWTMLNPLGTTIVLSIVFSQVFGAQQGYSAYVLSGLMPWTFFSQTTNACMVGLIWGGSLLKRIYLPRTVFAVSAIGTGIVNLLLSLVPLLFVMFTVGVYPKLPALFLPIGILFLSMFSLGFGLLLSTIAIQFADVTEMYQIVLTAWMYLSPVIYTEDKLPPQYIWIVHLNPMYYLINYFRAFIFDGRIPSMTETFIAGGVSAATLLVGWLVFSRKADEFAYRV